MNKNSFTKVALGKGEMHVYNFGTVKLHAYKTNDFIDNEVFIVEKNGKAVIIESPCFFDNNKELAQYIADIDVSVAGIFLAYHMGGGTFLPNVKKYASKNADIYGHSGGGKALIDQFTTAFGEVFDGSVHTITDYIQPGKINVGGIDFIITLTNDAYDIEIPETNAVYTHMLGHDCHSIVAGAGHAQGIIEQLNSYIAKGYSLILSSHYTPEDLKDAETKIGYLKQLQELANSCKNADAFKAAMKEKYPHYSGENYLDMTVSFFFS